MGGLTPFTTAGLAAGDAYDRRARHCSLMIIYGGAFTAKRGGISVPQGGLGIDPDPDVIKAYRRK
jgi:hypothetical protein